MSAIVLALTLVLLFKYFNASLNNVTYECPTGCKCELTTSLTELMIDCRKNIPNEGWEQAFHMSSWMKSDFINNADYLPSLNSANNLTWSTTYRPLTRVSPSDSQPQNLTMLYMLSDSNIAEIRENIIRFTHLPKLETLVLIYNGTVSLQDGMFGGLQSLKHLELVVLNASVVLQNGLFDGLHSLWSLMILYYPEIRNSTVILHDGLFDDLQSLATLTIALLPDGTISLQDGLFDGLQSLRGLYLPHNSITSLQNGLFDGQQHLNYLDLAYNQISFIELQVFFNTKYMIGLSLSHNSIIGLQDGLFYSLQILKILDLSCNSIVSLQDGLFDGLQSLVSLDLSHNQISFIGLRVFSDANLAKLETLSLHNNSMVGLQHGLFDGLQELVSLDLSYNSIVSLQNGLFDGLQNLVSLDLSYNQISFIGHRVFSYGNLANLKTLSLRHNSISRLPSGLFYGLYSLKTLDLQSNSISSFGLFVFADAGLAKLETLLLNGNSIVALDDMLFDGLHRLMTLDLSNNNISIIDRMFFNASQWTELRSLDLSHNKLTSLEPWWYQLCRQSRHKPRIILSYNGISHFTNKLKISIGCSKYNDPSGYLDLSYNSITYMTDIFNGWNITTDVAKCLFSNRAFTLYVAYNPYLCDCVDFPIFKMAKIHPWINILQDVHCTTFKTKLGQPMLASSIPLNVFICERPVGCPSSCRCAYRPGNYTLHIDCSAANLTSFPLDLPPLPNTYVKYKLLFSNNKLIRRLEHRLYFLNTTILDVSNCSLTEVTIEDLKDVSHFSVANFRGNLLQSFPSRANNVNISSRLSLIHI